MLSIMINYYHLYITLYLTVCAIAMFLFLSDRKAFAFSHKEYWYFLTKPWKLITFAIATAGMTLVAPYSGDCTWDYYDGGIMSLLVFISAPWAVGIVYKYYKKRTSFKQFYVAGCAWMFTVSWFYDLYMYMRTGQYPLTWWSNIMLSSILYFCGGVLWSIEWNTVRGVHISFEQEETWLQRSPGLVFPRLFIATLPFIFLVLLLCGIVIYGLNTGKWR